MKLKNILGCFVIFFSTNHIHNVFQQIIHARQIYLLHVTMSASQRYGCVTVRKIAMTGVTKAIAVSLHEIKKN